MRAFKIILFTLLTALCLAATGQQTTYELRKVMSLNPERADYSYWEFPNKAFKNDTVFYGESVEFQIYVDVNKHEAWYPSLTIAAEANSEGDSISTRCEYAKCISTVAVPDYPQVIFETTNDYSNSGYFNSVFEGGKLTLYPYDKWPPARSLILLVQITPLSENSWILVKSVLFKLTMGHMETP